MKMKTIYEKPEAQLRPSVIRCSILAGSTGQGTTIGENSGDEGTGNTGTKPLPKDPDDARRRGALYF